MAFCRMSSISSCSPLSGSLEHVSGSSGRQNSSCIFGPSSSIYLRHGGRGRGLFFTSAQYVHQLQAKVSISESSPSASKAKQTHTTVKEKMEIILYEDTADFEFEHGYSMAQVCDRLIDIFTLEKTNEMEWRKLLILSDDWYRIRDHFFKRCSYKGNNETDKVKKTSLASLSKKLEQVDADMQRHGQLLDYVKQNWPELDVIVAGRRQEFSNGFFQHMTILGDSYSSRIDKRDEIARLAAKCLAAVEAHDRALEDDEAVILAQQKFDKILDSLCLDEACSKIDELAKKKQLDSTLMLLFARAWAAANESTSMSEEMKELMHHLYLTARGHIQRLIPKEVRILQQLASIEEPTQRFKALTECFSPGDENAEKRTDIMYTKPEKLQKWLNLVLDGYHFNKQETVIESARQLMNPQLIHRLRQLQAIIEDQFM